MICARLSRIWKDEARLVRKALPEQYKRGYAEIEKDQPITEIEELFTIVKDISERITKVTNRILEKVKISPVIQKKILNNQLLTVEEKQEYTLTIEKQKLIFKAFGTRADLIKYLESLKDLSLDLKLVEENFDDRLKLDDYKRVIVKLYDLIYRYRAIGKIFHKSAKWIKQVVEDPELEKNH